MSERTRILVIREARPSGENCMYDGMRHYPRDEYITMDEFRTLVFGSGRKAAEIVAKLPSEFLRVESDQGDGEDG